jgi:tRNA U34 2-thiouridine synthase MnmA/TrmU
MKGCSRFSGAETGAMTDTPSKPNVRALGLCSGGLDSILSALVLRRQGIHVEWVSFETPFFSADKARRAADRNKIPLHVRNITADYMVMLKHPNAGFGKNMNPCMDCHALMFKKAGEIMQAEDFDFLFSGEVLGQRPMSQNKNAMFYVAKHSGVGPFILRPLSARRLPETAMEIEGKADRERLLDLTGRSRKPQIQLAAQFGVTEYPSPAGGCLLTDPIYSRRLKDLYDHEQDPDIQALDLLKFGRHMRLNPQVKLIVGRTQKENEQIHNCIDTRKVTLIKAVRQAGPTVVLTGDAPKEILFLAGAICVGYGKSTDDAPASVHIMKNGKKEQLTVLPVLPNEASRFLIK